MPRDVRDGPTFALACLFKYETDNAVLIHDFASKADIWLPLSQVVSMTRGKNGEGTIIMSEWIARQKGLC